MNLGELMELLDIARRHNAGGCLVAKTPHGTYTFDVVDVEIGLNTGDVTLRLEGVTE